MESDSPTSHSAGTQTPADIPPDIPPVGDGFCPFCRSAVAEGAVKCAACGSNVGDIRICTRCSESVRANAKICPYCQTDLAPESPEATALLKEPWVIEASPIGAAIVEQSVTALLYPPTMTITPTDIHIRRRMFLGLRTMDQKISVSRVASVRVLDGVIWGGIVVETYGGAAGDLAISGLDKEEARQTARLVERIAHVGSSLPGDASGDGM